MNQQDNAGAPGAGLHGVRLDAFFAALRSVVQAVTSAHTADCLLYATVAAAALGFLGVVDVETRAGSAIWRVGAGDSDLIVHAIELQGPQYAPALDHRALPFHAWLEVGDQTLLDFTTWSLRAKAKALDQLDGGSTAVEWCPDYLIAPMESATTLPAVQKGEHAGLYAYRRHPAIETVVLKKAPSVERLAPVVASVVMAYRASLQGHTTQVVGVGDDGSFQTEPAPVKYVEWAGATAGTRAAA